MRERIANGNMQHFKIVENENSMFTGRGKLIEDKPLPVRPDIGVRKINKNSFDSVGIILYSRTIFFGYA